jgi:tetratricopeptide (TPR) repeat protein
MKSTDIQFKIAVVALALLGWAGLSLGLADFYARENPQRALFWRSGHPEALFRMAEKSVTSKDWAAAQDYAERALRANPLDGRSLRILAQCAQQKGNATNALELYKKASQLAPRDVESHLWLLEYALNNKQAEMAVFHLHALLTLKPAMFIALQEQLNALAANPSVQPFLVKQLATYPTWRLNFLNSVAASKQPIDLIAPLYVQLNLKSELEPVEYLPWIRRLKSENRFAQAYVTWANMIPKSHRKYLGNVFDGGFELPLEEQAGDFSWTSSPIDGAQAQLLSTRGTLGENSYYVEFEGRRTAFANLSQSIQLPAGAWQFSFRARADRLDNPRGVVWHIVCENDGQVLADSEPMQGRFDWQEINFTFKVPENCVGQKLTLMIPARIPAETMISGALWLDNIKIQAVETIL